MGFFETQFLKSWDDCVGCQTGEKCFLWSTVGERALAKGFTFNLGDAKYSCVCRKKNEAA